MSVVDQENKQIAKQQSTSNSSFNDIDDKSVKLKIDLELVEKNGSIAHVNQSIILPYLKEPAFVKGAYKQIENTLNLVGVDLFKRLVRQYFLNLADNFYSDQNMSASDLLLPTSMDSKMVVTNSDNGVTELATDQNEGNNNSGNEKLDLNLEVE